MPPLTLVVADSAPGPLGAAFLAAVEHDVRAGRLQVVVVAESEPRVLRGGPEGVRWLPAPAGSTVPSRRGLGLASARTELVALTESFCVPAPGWTEAVLEAHAVRDVAAVGGPVDRSGGTAAHWALTFLEYGRFMGPEPSGPVSDLPGINVAYRVGRLRDALGGLPDEVVEVELHRKLLDAGETLWRHPGAVMLDASSMAPASARRAQRLHGRFYGGTRVAGAGRLQRAVRALVTPAVPLVVGARIARGALAAGRGGAFARSLPHLAGLLASWAAGEAMGSLLGPGRSGDAWR